MIAADNAVAVLIPTLNEAQYIGPLLDSLLSMDFAEIAVADGGSTDGTLAQVRQRSDVLLISAPRGRGLQLAAACDATKSPLLLLLHADTCLPAGAVECIRTSLCDPEVAGGSFRLRFDDGSPALTFYAWATRFETGFTTFGDQAFFATRRAIKAAGGIPAIPLLEDVALRRKLQSVGRFIKLCATVTTSARRFKAHGALRCQIENAMILAAYRMGADPARLARWYAPTHHHQ